MARAAPGRPLYDNAADRGLFVTPPVWAPLERAVARKVNTMVTGARGSGKSTLLRQLQLALREAGQRVVFVDAGAGVDVGELVARVHDAVAGVAAAGGARADAPPPGAPTQTLYATLERIGAADPAVVLVDAAGSPEAVHGLFGRLRDVIWQYDHVWVVAVDEHERGTALKPPADAFFDVVLRLDPLPPEDLDRLLELREPDSAPPVRAAIAADAAGNPREALRALTVAAVHGRDVTEGLRGRVALIDAASDVGRPHAMVMTELLDRGQASSSDEALQRTLGVSRARLSQILRELLDHGLVGTDTERHDGPGRPRTVYRPARSDP